MEYFQILKSEYTELLEIKKKFLKVTNSTEMNEFDSDVENWLDDLGVDENFLKIITSVELKHLICAFSTKNALHPTFLITHKIILNRRLFLGMLPEGKSQRGNCEIEKDISKGTSRHGNAQIN